jgi:hypothetical protein
MSNMCRDEAPTSIDQIPVTANSVSKIMIIEPSKYSTFRKYEILYDVIKDFSVKDKRRVFAEMRTTNINVTPDTFFPQYGFTAGEFSTWAVLTENNRKKYNRKSKTKKNPSDDDENTGDTDEAE